MAFGICSLVRDGKESASWGGLRREWCAPGCLASPLALLVAGIAAAMTHSFLFRRLLRGLPMQCGCMSILCCAQDFSGRRKSGADAAMHVQRHMGGGNVPPAA